jgi:hypothetical protein
VPLPLLIGGIAVAIAIVAGLILLFTGDEGSPAPTSPSPSAIADPFRKVCRDLVDVQLLREDALDRASEALTADAAALRARGDEESAAAVEAIVDAIGSYQEVAAGGGDTVAATNQLLDALNAVDCSGAAT